MTNNEITLWFAFNLLALPEDPKGFEKYCKRVRQNKTRSNWSEKRWAQHNSQTLVWGRHNPERRRSISRESAQRGRDENPGRAAGYMRTWRAANPERNLKTQRGWSQKMWKRGGTHKIGKLLRNRINDALGRYSRAGTLVDVIGCSVAEFKKHLEKLFFPGMTWKNHGEWHIDHIKPCAKFDLSDPAQQHACFHYTNLQPLWAIDNLRKGAR